MREGLLAHFRLKRRYMNQVLREWFPEAVEGGAKKESVDPAAAGTNNVLGFGLSLPSVPQFLGGGPSSSTFSSFIAQVAQQSVGQQPNHEVFSPFSHPALAGMGFGQNGGHPSQFMSKTNLESIISDLASIPPHK